MFPITYRHQFNYAVQGDERWIAGMLRLHFATSLQKKGAQKVTIDSPQVLFGGRFLDPTYWGFLLAIISKGKITVTCSNNQLNLTLELSFAGYAVMALAGLLWIMVIFIWWSARNPDSSTPNILFVLIAFGLLYTGYGAIYYLEFSKFLQDQVAGFFNSVANVSIQGKRITSY
jgi:hypothetical protein